MHYCRKAADTGISSACLMLAQFMYADHPHAREAGHVGGGTGRGLHSSTFQLNVSRL
jgi:hypothetical protein